MNAKNPEVPPQALNVEPLYEASALPDAVETPYTDDALQSEQLSTGGALPHDEEDESGIFNKNDITWLKKRFKLTDDEVQTLNLAGQGKTDEEIGGAYGIGDEDVRRRMREEIWPKLGALNCTHAVTIVFQGLRQEYDQEGPDTLPAAPTPPSSAFAEHRRQQRELGLTRIESEVVALAARGFSNKEIAEALKIKTTNPETTVKDHMRRIWTKQEARGLKSRSRIKTITHIYGVSGRVPAKARKDFGVEERQGEVLELVARGLENQQIADRLVLSIDTVKTHVKRLLGKTGARNRTHLVAITCGIVYSPLARLKTDEIDVAENSEASALSALD